MKKLIFTSMLCCAVFGNSFAQYTILTNKNAINNDYETRMFSLGEYGDSFVIYKQSGTSASQKGVQEEIVKVNKKTLATTIFKVSLPSKLPFGADRRLGSCFVNEKTCGVTLATDNFKEKTLDISTRIVQGSNTLTFNEKVIDKIPSDRGNRWSRMSATSQDKSKNVLIINLLKPEKKVNNDGFIYDKTYVYLFDNSGNLIWKTNFALNFARPYFNFQSVGVSDDGKVYLAVTSYENVKNRQQNQVIQTYSINENGIEKTQLLQKNNFCVTDLKVRVLKNGNVFLGGYYSDKPTNAKREEGYFGHDIGSFESSGKFGLLLKDENLDELNFNTISFKTSIPKGSTLAQAYSPDYFSVVEDIIETSDDIITIVGKEIRQEPESTFFRGLIQVRNILVDAFNQSGDVVNSSILFYKQGNDPAFIPSVINAKDKIIVIYNDSKENSLSQNKPIDKEYSLKSFNNKGMVVVCEIINGEVGKKHKIMDSTETKQIFDKAEIVTDKTAIFITTDMKKLFSNILSW